MLEHEVKSKVLTIGNRKGQTAYYAYPKLQQKLTYEMVVERIVRETSLSEGDVKSALVSLSNVVCDAMKLSIDRARPQPPVSPPRPAARRTTTRAEARFENGELRMEG